MKEPHVVSGRAFIGEELAFRPVDIIIERHMITAIEDNVHAPEIWICPALFNAHTHIGDTIAMDYGIHGDLASLVTPPHSLKSRLLAAASREDLVEGMRSTIKDMISGGIAGCADFREGGPDGVSAFREAVKGLSFCPLIFGREGGESMADGLGISSIRDVPDAEAQITHARRNGKMIAFHAGERDADDVDAAIASDPDFIVHATHATKKQLRECAEQEIPIVVCPRSNWMLGVSSSAKFPPLQVMIDLGCTIFLGTDNVMFVAPDLMQEMAFVSTIYKLDPITILRSATGGSIITGSPFFISEGARANLVVMEPDRSALRFSRDPAASLIKRAHRGWICKNVFSW
jgi:cytosine/adenosine deaminase-related metal-dependent hydrolase